jgi:hypothetical protein
VLSKGSHHPKSQLRGEVRNLESDRQQVTPRRCRDHRLGTRPRSFALCGFGGLGKTQIATRYAFAREKDFDAIFWIQADEVGKLYKSFHDIAKALGLVDEGDQSDMVVSRDKVLQLLFNPRKQQPAAANPAGETKFTKWLMVFDNADNIDLMTEFWPSTSYGSIPVTSRDPWPRRTWPRRVYISRP